MVQSHIHVLRREYENVVMNKDELVSDFSCKFSNLELELRNLGENR